MSAPGAVHQHVRAGAAHHLVRERTVPIDADPGSVFAACQRLFRDYPLAVRRHYAEFRYGSLVLAARSAGTATFSVLVMERDDLFVIRPWDRRDWARVEIRHGELIPPQIVRLISTSVPVPRDGALLGWVSGGQVRAILAAHGRLPEPWDDPFAVPGIAVLPLAGSDEARWPPVPLTEARLWAHASGGQLADMTKLVARQPGYAYWVPAQGHHLPSCVVVTERIGTAQCWLAAGVYADYQALRDGTSLPPPRQLLAVSGVTDLAAPRRRPAGVPAETA